MLQPPLPAVAGHQTSLPARLTWSATGPPPPPTLNPPLHPDVLQALLPGAARLLLPQRRRAPAPSPSATPWFPSAAPASSEFPHGSPPPPVLNRRSSRFRRTPDGCSPCSCNQTLHPPARNPCLEPRALDSFQWQ